MTDNLAGLGPQYEAAADRYSSHAANGLYNAHYDRPAGSSACMTSTTR